jgi:hypothetical protein
VLVALGGLLVTAALVVGVVFLWPDGDDSGDRTVASTGTTVLTPLDNAPGTDGLGEPSRTTAVTPVAPTQPVDLFETGAPAAYAAVLGAAKATQLLEVLVYPEYAFVSYRDPAHPANIDQREWRNGQVGPASANTIDDRYDAETAPRLFGAGELDLAVLSKLVDDAPKRFALPTEVTHVIVNRFLPFDQRVIIRVYASPSDGRSGGGYVQYLTDGAYLKTVQ